jgi:hypothetical protein
VDFKPLRLQYECDYSQELNPPLEKNRQNPRDLDGPHDAGGEQCQTPVVETTWALMARISRDDEWPPMANQKWDRDGWLGRAVYYHSIPHS